MNQQIAQELDLAGSESLVLYGQDLRTGYEKLPQNRFNVDAQQLAAGYHRDAENTEKLEEST